MALIAHYPLNGDTNDYSGNGNNLTYTNNNGLITTNNNGKIGKCYERTVSDTNSDLYRSMNKINLPESFTMACWAYVSECCNSANGLVTNHNHNTNSGAGITTKYISATDFRISCNTGTGTSRTYHTYYGTTNIKDKWSHLIIRFDKNTNTLKLFVNGVEEFSIAYTMVCETDYVDIFNWSTGFFGQKDYRPKCKLNDVRIYDHALSIKEIKEIYKTKILHYNFNDMQEPTANLLADKLLTTYTYANLTNGTDGIGTYFIKADNTLWYAGVSCPYTNLTTGKWYTFSFDVLCDTAFNLQFDPNVSATGASGNDNWESHTYTSRYTDVNNWQRVFATIRCKDGLTSPQFHTAFCPNDVNIFGKKLYYRNAQLEEKAYGTSYISNTRTGTVHDSSGYKNDATLDLATTPQWTSNSIIGSGAYNFVPKSNALVTDGSSLKEIKCNSLKNYSIEQCTISFWAYKTAAGYQSGGCFKWGSNGATGIDIYDGRIYLLGLTSSCNSLFDTPLNEWCLVTIVIDKFSTTPLKIYKNGIKASEVTSAMSTQQITTSTEFILGYSNAGGVYRHYNGSVDDVRIYATALTDQDILDLYKSKASISKDSKFYVNELVEANSYCDYAQGLNLVTNGAVEYNDTTNIGSLATIITTDGVSNGKCFERVGSTTLITSEFIEVNTSDSYELSGYFKSVGVGGGSKLYYGLACYDKDKNIIAHTECHYYDNTKTTLAQDLKPGDTTVYLTSTVNWQIGTQGVTASTKYLGIFNKDGYPDYVRSKYHTAYTDVDTINNTITLSSAWVSGTIPTGTKVANNWAGGNYIYSAGIGEITPATWTKRAGTIVGMSHNGGDKTFRPGTRYVKILFLHNYAQTVDYITRFTDIYFKNLSRQQANLNQIGFNVSKKSVGYAKELNEFPEIAFDRTGVHKVMIGNEVLPVYVDNDYEGGQWIRVFYHNNNAGTSMFSMSNDWAEAKETNKLSPTDVNKYSILSKLESLRRTDGKFEFMLRYPTDDAVNKNIWYQTSNPTTSAIAGYEAKSISWTDNYWGGLEKNTDNTSCFIDGSVGNSNWYYAIGARNKYESGMPAWSSVSHASTPNQVELYVRTDKKLPRVMNDRFQIDKQGNIYSKEFIEI